MATHFARSIISPRYTHSARLSPDCLLQLNQLPEHRRARFHAARSLLAEMMHMLYGCAQLPAIAVSLSGRPGFIDSCLPNFSISYAGNMVGVALTTEGECGLSMALPHNPLALTGFSAESTVSFSRSEITWINNQNSTFEGRALLTALRQSIAKLNGQRDFNEQQFQLFPGAGRVRARQGPPIEAMCDIEEVLVWAISATPAIGQLRMWEYGAATGWRTLGTIPPESHGPRNRIMRFTSMIYEKAANFH